MAKVAVIGGGPAGLAAAWHLSHADPEAEITVYQQGWRLGGKGAASRGPAGRIEEHGIHLFGNFYGNALGMIRDAYLETGRSLDQELLPNNLHLSLDLESGRRFSTRVADTRNPSDVLGDDNIDPTLLKRKLFEAVVEASIGMIEVPDGPPGVTSRAAAWARRTVANTLTNNVVTRRTARRLITHRPRTVTPELDSAQYEAAIRSALKWGAFVRLLGWLARMSPRAAIRYETTDLLFTTLRGALADDVFARGIDSIDGEDHLTWLRRHGASERTLASPVARAAANICFQYAAGDTASDPDMSAAAFVTFVLRQMAAPGPNFWYFKHGTGESVVLPLYDALTTPGDGRRPVRFEFFTRISDLVPGVADDGEPIITRIDLRRHVRPAGSSYDPIVELNGVRCWPDRPVLDRIHPEDVPLVEGRDLEDWYALLPDEPGVDETLHLEHDFDVVVLATPPPAHAWTCPSLLEDPSWRSMVEGLEFIGTQGVQLWLADGGEDIGLPGGPYRADAERWSSAEWRNPNSCWVDFSDLIAEEHWQTERRPASLMYFCGPLRVGDEPLPDPGDVARRSFPATAHARVVEGVHAMLADMGKLLPGTTHEGAFRYDRLVSPDGQPDPPGPERLGTQYLRANVVPTERYGLSRPGHLAHRRTPWNSGYRNLALAGDWVYTGFNINSFEGATMSGALASYAICGSPDPSEIIGYDFMRPSGGPRR